MNVQELIDALEAIEDKGAPVVMSVEYETVEEVRYEPRWYFNGDPAVLLRN